MRFDLTDLSLFRHVVEAGSITRGAERAHLALAAASTRIRNMEEALGAPLPAYGHLANILESQYTETGVAVTAQVPPSLANGAPGATYAQEFGVVVR